MSVTASDKRQSAPRLPRPAGGQLAGPVLEVHVMPWGRLDDTLYDHPKLDELGKDRLPAIGLWTLSISWCNRFLTDGYLPGERIVRLGGTKALADKLVEAGLFEAAGEAYAVHDFLAFNKSRTQVEAERAYERDRWQRRRSGQDSAPDSKVYSAPESGRTPRGTPSVPSIPVLPYHSPPDPRVQVDERELTEEQNRERYIAAQAKQTGVKS